MDIKWTSEALDDFQNIISHNHFYSEKSHNSYINSLLNFISLLSLYPHLDKLFLKNSNVKIRQAVYKKHKIFYKLLSSEIHILTILHTSQNSKTLNKYIKKFLD